MGAAIHFGAHALDREYRSQLFGLPMDRLCPRITTLDDGHDHHLCRRQPRRHDDPVVVAVRHHQPPDHSGGDTPRRVPRVLLSPLHALELQIELLREILPQEMRRSGLERPVVLHECLEAVCPHRTREPFRVRLEPSDDRHGDPLLHEVAVDSEYPEGLLLGLVRSCMRCVALLPQELGRAKKEPGPKLPAHHVGPLVQKDRKVAVALHPLGIHRVDDGLRRRTYDQRLLKVSPARVGDDGQLWLEPLDVLRFLLDEALRDE